MIIDSKYKWAFVPGASDANTIQSVVVIFPVVLVYQFNEMVTQCAYSIKCMSKIT